MLKLNDNLMIAIVNEGQAERFMSIARKAGAGGGTVMPAKGTASGKILNFLGLGTKARELILMVTDRATADKVVEEIRTTGHMQGVAAMLRSEKEENMASRWKMITIIVSTGYSDDIMNAARKAGATGGTVTHARGTGTEDDVRFMGVEIVPEKEMIMILCDADKTQKIVDAVTSLKCLDAPGIGVLYTQDVSDFRNLDPNK